jgi:hypothetical protein
MTFLTHRGPPPLVCSIIQRSIPSFRNRQSVPILKAGILPRLTSLRRVEEWTCNSSQTSFTVKTSRSITIGFMTRTAP